jgi:hypothetical protein
MPKMYKDGSESIDVHPSQIENAKVRGWSLDEKPAKKEKLINTDKE